MLILARLVYIHMNGSWQDDIRNVFFILHARHVERFSSVCGLV